MQRKRFPQDFDNSDSSELENTQLETLLRRQRIAVEKMLSKIDRKKKQDPTSEESEELLIVDSPILKTPPRKVLKKKSAIASCIKNATPASVKKNKRAVPKWIGKEEERVDRAPKFNEEELVALYTTAFKYRSDIIQDFANLPKEERDGRKRKAFKQVTMAVNAAGGENRRISEVFFKYLDHKSICRKKYRSINAVYKKSGAEGGRPDNPLSEAEQMCLDFHGPEAYTMIPGTQRQITDESPKEDSLEDIQLMQQAVNEQRAANDKFREAKNLETFNLYGNERKKVEDEERQPQRKISVKKDRAEKTAPKPQKNIPHSSESGTKRISEILAELNTAPNRDNFESNIRGTSTPKCHKRALSDSSEDDSDLVQDSVIFPGKAGRHDTRPLQTPCNPMMTKTRDEKGREPYQMPTKLEERVSSVEDTLKVIYADVKELLKSKETKYVQDKCTLTSSDKCIGTAITVATTGMTTEVLPVCCASTETDIIPVCSKEVQTEYITKVIPYTQEYDDLHLSDFDESQVPSKQSKRCTRAKKTKH